MRSYRGTAASQPFKSLMKVMSCGLEELRASQLERVTFAGFLLYFFWTIELILNECIPVKHHLPG